MYLLNRLRSVRNPLPLLLGQPCVAVRKASMDTLASCQSFLDKLGCPVCMLDVSEGSIAMINDAAMRRLGYSREECRRLSIERFLSPGELPASESGGIVKVRPRNEAAPSIPFRTSSTQLDGREFVLLIAEREVTSSQGARSDQASPEGHSDLSPAFEIVEELLSTGDLDALCRKTVEFAWQRLGLEECALWLTSSESQELRGTFSISRSGAMRNEQGSPTRSWAEPKIAGWQGWKTDPRIWHQTRLASSQGKPKGGNDEWETAIELRMGDRLIGVLFSNMADTGALVEACSLENLTAYCSTVARIIHQRSPAPEPEKEGNPHHGFSENPAVGILAASLDGGCILWANATLQQFTGLPPGEVKGKRFTDLLASDGASEVARLLEQFGAGEIQSCCTRNTIVRADGVQVPVHLTFSAVASEHRWPGHLAIVVEDVTEWSNAERQKRDLKEGLQLITTAANELLACTSLDELCRKAVELVRERLGLERTGLFLLDEEGKLHGTYGTTLEGTTSDEHALLYDRQSWAGEFLPPWRPDPPRWIVRLGQLPGQPESTMVHDPDRWLAVTPICSAEGPIGIFCNDNAITGKPWDESAQELVNMLATVLGTIIREKRVEEELWRARTSLEQRVRERTAQLDLANTALQLEICERQRAERELRSVAKHAHCILWYAKIEGLEGWQQDTGDGSHFSWSLHVQDEAAAQRVLPLEIPAGKTYGEILRQNLSVVAHMWSPAISALQGNIEAYTQEFSCSDMFGQLRWLCADVQIQRLAENRWEAFGLTTDVTTRKQAREEILRLNRDLQERVAELQTLLDTIPIGIAIATDRQCSHISVNPYLAKLLGVEIDANASLNSSLGLRPSEFLMCRDGKELAPEQMPMQLAAQGETVAYMEFDIVRHDAELVPVMASAVPLRDANGNPRGCVAAFTDISERIRAEEGLRNVAAHTGSIFWHGELKEIQRSEEDLQRGLPRFGWRLHVQDEKAAQKVLPLDVLPGQRYADIWIASRDVEDAARVEALCATNLQAGKNSWSHEYRCTNRFGEVQWFMESVRLKKRRPGRWQVFGVFLDITERKRSDEKMARLAAIVESSDDAIFSATLEGQILTWNAGAEKLFDYSADEVKGRQLSTLVPEDRKNELQEILTQVSAGKQIAPYETVRLRKDGSPVQVSLSVSPVRDPSGKITGAAATARDVTASKRLEKDVLDISAHEQQRIGQDLHDGICQQLTGAYFLTSVLKHKLEGVDPSLATEANKVAILLSTVTEQARQLARGLHPLESSPKGLITALGELTDQINHLFKVQCRFLCEQDIVISDPATATHLYRIAQEASNNAVRHGEATHINIELRQNSGEIWLIIEDDGKGFHTEIETFSGMGLRTMRYRAGVIGGKLIIESGSPGGTLICCVLPVRHACAPEPTVQSKLSQYVGAE